MKIALSGCIWRHWEHWHLMVFVSTTMWPSVRQMRTLPTKPVMQFSSSGCCHPRMRFQSTTAAAKWKHRHWKGNYYLQSKRKFLLLKQMNARPPGHLNTMHIASRSSPACFWGHLMSAILSIDVLLKANKYSQHQPNSANLTLLEANAVLRTSHVHHPWAPSRIPTGTLLIDF